MCGGNCFPSRAGPKTTFTVYCPCICTMHMYTPVGLRSRVHVRGLDMLIGCDGCHTLNPSHASVLIWPLHWPKKSNRGPPYLSNVLPDRWVRWVFMQTQPTNFTCACKDSTAHPGGAQHPGAACQEAPEPVHSHLPVPAGARLP